MNNVITNSLIAEFFQFLLSYIYIIQEPLGSAIN